MVLFFTSHSFSADYYGYIEYDSHTNICFMGVNVLNREYTKILSGRLLTQEQIDLMKECTELQKDGERYAIMLNVTQQEEYHVDCKQFSPFEYKYLLRKWDRDIPKASVMYCEN